MFRPIFATLTLLSCVLLETSALAAGGVSPSVRTPLHQTFERVQADKVSQSAENDPPSKSAGHATEAPQGHQTAVVVTHKGRLTPDERRALRRQINEAKQELYAPHN